MPALNYSTTIAVDKTLGEIQKMLGKAGAKAVAVMYQDGRSIGMTFTLDTPAGLRAFQVPVDVPAMQRLLTKQRRTNKRVSDKQEQAERVAWRVIKDWLAAQLALIEAQMATLDEVMLPYLVTGQDRTLRDDWRDRAALPSGETL
jgi:hypothetical protein